MTDAENLGGPILGPNQSADAIGPSRPELRSVESVPQAHEQAHWPVGVLSDPSLPALGDHLSEDVLALVAGRWDP